MGGGSPNREKEQQSVQRKLDKKKPQRILIEDPTNQWDGWEAARGVVPGASVFSYLFKIPALGPLIFCKDRTAGPSFPCDCCT